MKKHVFIISIILIIFFTVNYSYLDSKLKQTIKTPNFVNITKIIDGDTLIANNQKIRLLGINAPEKGEKYFKEAKEFLEKNSLNKNAILIYGKYKKDKYNRTLAYIIVNGENINKKLIEEGLANVYFPSERSSYYEDFIKSWKKCIKLNKNLCKKSVDICSSCIKLKKFNPKKEEIYLQNICNFECDLTNWSIKDEGRKKFIFKKYILKPNEIVLIKVGNKKDSSKILYWKNEKYVWTKNGDSLFLRDNKSDLVLWKTY